MRCEFESCRLNSSEISLLDITEAPTNTASLRRSEMNQDCENVSHSKKYNLANGIIIWEIFCGGVYSVEMNIRLENSTCLHLNFVKPELLYKYFMICIPAYNTLLAKTEGKTIVFGKPS